MKKKSLNVLMMSLCLTACAIKPSTVAAPINYVDVNKTILEESDGVTHSLRQAPEFLKKLKKAPGLAWEEVGYAPGIQISGEHKPVEFKRDNPIVLNRPERVWQIIPEELSDMASYTYEIGVSHSLSINVSEPGYIYALLAQHVHSKELVTKLLNDRAVPLDFGFTVAGTNDTYLMWQIPVEEVYAFPPSKREHGFVVLVPTKQVDPLTLNIEQRLALEKLENLTLSNGVSWTDIDYANGIEVAGEYQTVPFESGQKVAVNNNGVSWLNVPEELSGMTAFISRVRANQPSVRISVAEPGFVFVMLAKNAHRVSTINTLLSAGAVPTDYTFEIDGSLDEYVLWQLPVTSDHFLLPRTQSNHGFIVLKPTNVYAESGEKNVAKPANVREPIVLNQEDFKAPLKSYWITKRYGNHYNSAVRKLVLNNDIDLAAKFNEEVHVSMPGVVIRVGTWQVYGNRIEVAHGGGYITTYSHLNEVYVKEGDKLSQCQIIGAVGETGRATGPHLGYAVIYKQEHIDPQPFLNRTRGRC